MSDPDVSAPPPRWKRIEDLTVNEHLERRRTGELPESDAYKAYRAEVLERAGVEEESNPGNVAIEDLSIDGHVKRKYGTNRGENTR